MHLSPDIVPISFWHSLAGSAQYTIIYLFQYACQCFGQSSTLAMPAHVMQADGGAVAWRKWFNGRGRGGPTKAAGQSPLVPAHGLPRTQLLDRHAQHVSQCSSCQNGLRLLQRTQTVLKGASAAAFLGVAAALGKGDVELVSVGSAGAVLGIAGLLWLASFLHGAESKFLFSDYVHAKR